MWVGGRHTPIHIYWTLPLVNKIKFIPESLDVDADKVGAELRVPIQVLQLELGFINVKYAFLIL